MKKTIKRILIGTFAVVGAYFIIGIILSDVVFPPEKIDYANCFQTGDRLISNSEGFDQTILSSTDGWVHLRLDARPFGAGPPVHLHETFEETFYVKTGTLSLMVGSEKKTLRAGESFTVPRLTPHKPFNETGETVVVMSDEDTKTMPNKFAYFLSQIYPLVDSFEGRPSTFAMIMQFSVYGSEIDSFLADGPPIVVQKAMRVLLRPTARLLGYKYYYEEFRPQHLK